MSETTVDVGTGGAAVAPELRSRMAARYSVGWRNVMKIDRIQMRRKTIALP